MSSNGFSEKVRTCSHHLSEHGVPALSQLFDLTSHRLVRLAVTITRNQHDAEDAVQSVLVRVADAPGKFACANEPWRYLLRAVRNEALLILRRRKRIVGNSEIIDLLTQHRIDEVEQEETHREIWTALRKLPVDQSEVIVLKVWEELTFSEIGEVLEISSSTAASRYRYALEKLAKHLGSHQRRTTLASKPRRAYREVPNEQ